METDTTTETDALVDTSAGEGQADDGTISIPKTDYDRLNQTIGSLKRDLKDLRMAKKETAETPKKTESQELGYGEKAFMTAKGLQNAEEMQLAWDFAKRTGDPLETVLEDEVFRGRLEKIRTTKANELAADGKTDRGTQSHGDEAERWLAKNGMDTPVDMSLSREVRQKIVAARSKAAKDGKQFYND